MKKQIIIFTDCGDTIINEGSEIRAAGSEVVCRAECIPQAKETMQQLFAEGYVIALVADGLVQSFENVLTQNELNHIFSATAISAAVGAEKPDQRMFQEAMDQLGLTDQDKKRIIMVGNNIERDIVGANRFGITSVLLTWSPRYPMIPRTAEETPDYQIASPQELLALVQRLEANA